MEYRNEIGAIVREATLAWTAEANPGPESFLAAWARVRRQLRALRDTSTSVNEDERTACELLQQLQSGGLLDEPARPEST